MGAPVTAWPSRNEGSQPNKPQRRHRGKARQSRNRTARSVWSAWSLLPLSCLRLVKQRQQAGRTPCASRLSPSAESSKPTNNFNSSAKRPEFDPVLVKVIHLEPGSRIPLPADGWRGKARWSRKGGVGSGIRSGRCPLCKRRWRPFQRRPPFRIRRLRRKRPPRYRG